MNMIKYIMAYINLEQMYFHVQLIYRIDSFSVLFDKYSVDVSFKFFSFLIQAFMVKIWNMLKGGLLAPPYPTYSSFFPIGM